MPEVLVEEVLEWLTQRGYADVEIVKTAEESIVFSLPKELRRDLRAEAAGLVAGTGTADAGAAGAGATGTTGATEK